MSQYLILPGVAHFGHCLAQMTSGGFLEAVRTHISLGKPFLGICVGMQALFEGSAEDPTAHGLGLIPGKLQKFESADKSVPHVGWNSAAFSHGDNESGQCFYGLQNSSKYYYGHSYAVPYESGLLEKQGWTVATATYGKEIFIGAIARGNVLATQFHPEKSGLAGLRVIRAFLKRQEWTSSLEPIVASPDQGLTRRVIACLDVRANEVGDLVVTKGDQYDVREKHHDSREGKA